MKPAVLSLLAIGSSGFFQSSVTLTRSFKGGDKSTYKLHISEVLESADADIDATYTETVKKVDDGGAELDVSVGEFKITAGGMDIPAPGPEPRTIKVDKNGVMVGAIEENSVSRLIPDLYLGFAYGKELTSGKEVSVDYTDTGEVKSKTTGAVTLDSVTNGVAKLVEKLKIEYPGDQPDLHMDITAYVNVSDSKLDHMEGKLTTIPNKLAGRYMVQSAEFKVTKG